MSISLVADMVREAEKHAEITSKDRTAAIEYYEGTMRDTPSDANRSAFVSRDVREHIKKALPSIMRTILGNGEIVEFSPMAEGDEEAAEQASDYINYVVLPEADGETAIYDAIHDALLCKNGIIKWWHEEKACVKFSKHSGLTDDELTVLAAEDGVEIKERTERVEVIEQMTEAGPMPVEITVHDVTMRRTFTERKICVSSVPRENFLIHPDAVTLQDSILTGEKTELRRSDLIAMGYDKDMVLNLSVAGEDDDERQARRDVGEDSAEADRANDPIDFYDMYIRLDLDGDGIAELRRMCFAGGLTEDHLLENDECDEVQFCDVAAMRQPHQWEGISLADDLMDIQRVKTVLMRQTLDNMYWQNNPQPMYQKGTLTDQGADALFNPSFGKPIAVSQGIDVRAAVGFTKIPFMARESFGMLEYMDQTATDRTGISDASAGLAPDALQNMTAKASAMIEQAGIGQTEMIVREIASSLKPLFKGLLRLVTRHQDKPRTIRLRNEWVTFDPRHWNAEMDVKINTGLGAGTRERDMMVMQQVLTLQEKLLGAFGPDNPFVKPDNLHNSITKLVEAAGLTSPADYFTAPDPQEIQAKMQAAKNQPNPDQMKVEAQLKIEQAKLQAQVAKEKAQMDADLRVRQAQIQADSQRHVEELASKLALQERDLAFKREELQVKMATDAQNRAQDRQDAIDKHIADKMAADSQKVAAE